MKSGDLDVMLNIVKTPERQKYLLYTKPYAFNPNTMLSRREAPYDDLGQLTGKTVALPKGFFYEEILKRDYPLIKLLLVKDVTESMKLVAFGKAEAALGELAVFNYLMGRDMMAGLVVSGEVNLGGANYSQLNIASFATSSGFVIAMAFTLSSTRYRMLYKLYGKIPGSCTLERCRKEPVLGEGDVHGN
jgi:ABC-type amino acid transport substrate-binding protein